VIGCTRRAFFTGALIAPFGLRAIMATGLALIVAAATVGFWASGCGTSGSRLCCSGSVGNFGSSVPPTLLTECHGPRERNKVQALQRFF